MNIRHFVALLSSLLISGPPAHAQPARRGASIVPAAPNSALVRLTSPQVTADAMQRLGPGLRWRYQPGQPAGWASPATDDHTWPLVDASFPFKKGPVGWRGTGCFRVRFTLDSALLGQPLGFRFRHAGASEIYLDGQLLGRLGTPGTSRATTTGWWPSYQTLPFMLREAGPHLLAVRYAQFDPRPAEGNSGFTVRVAPAPRLIAENLTILRLADVNIIGLAGSAVLMLLHLFLFLYYRAQRANLYGSLYMAALFATDWFRYSSFVQSEMKVRFWSNVGFETSLALGSVMLLAFAYAICQRRIPWWWLLLLGGGWLGVVAWYAGHSLGGIKRVSDALVVLSFLNMFWVLGGALRRRQPGIWLVAVGALGTLLVYVFTASSIFQQRSNDVALPYDLGVQVGLLLLPVCLSLYLARDFAVTRRSLEVQLRQVQELSAQTRRQEAERQQLISAQNEQLESTVQRRTEEIQRQNTVLAAQKAEITAQADQLQTLDEAKSRFFTNLTHEFRTPLTLMLGPAEQIVAESQQPAVRQQATLVQRNAQHLLRLINQLLDLSKLEAGHLALEPVSADLVPFVRGLVGSFESLAQQRCLACSFAADQAALLLDFDPGKLEKIVYNLLSNAFKFTPSGGQVAVRLAQTAEVPSGEEWVELTVHDTGQGIAPAQLPHVFDRFFQADSSSTREQEGSGIGLALTKELVELHGGTIVLHSAPTCGTTAVVRLPVRHLAAPAAGPLLTAEPVTKPHFTEPHLVVSKAQAAEPVQVLVIEDNAEVRAFLRSTLAPHYQVLEAADGEAGVALAREQVPDFVLTDVMMPRLDGHGVCRALRQDERTSHIPVVLLTAQAGLESKLEGLHTGVDAYLSKPFHPTELLATIASLLRSRQLLRDVYRRGLVASTGLGLPSLEQAFVARVQQVVIQHLDDETFNVETLARQVALSRTQLHRKLKALTGQAPGDFIRAVRLNRAHELLVGQVGTVSEIAYQVGYSNPANFSTSFARHFGYPPGEARSKRAV
ncbi:ATP-binding protein [Hymenobacter negativus]|uniref:histidine kinase n=1 Tax=Hymenobacter negativus TaxID=2795026 RepID=A0ABS3QNW7_9BACT|nr:ATP-binding protein [Hymenobacter negativus]MBO2012974.1 response regulator [Hymenobacter negativus]